LQSNRASQNTTYMKIQFTILMLVFLLLPSFALAATFSASPSFVPTTNSTNITFTTTNGNDRWTSFDADTGVWDNGGDLGDGTHTWDSEFGINNAGKHTLVEYSSHPGSCYGTDLATCLAGGTVIATFDVCLTDNTECAGGGGGGSSSDDTDGLPFGLATTTYSVIDNPNLDYALGVFLFFGLTFSVLFLFKRR